MAIDAKDLGALEKALNDAAGKASVLWTTFVTFELYLAIAFGSVKHRDLFLETPVKLPILNVDLPLAAFFLLAPAILVIFHFYVFLQLYGLATKAREYNDLLKEQAQAESDRQRVRQRLDTFFILQFLAGPKEQRGHFQGFSLRLIAWITLVGAPILILLQAQVMFLAYHHEPITWVQRLLLLIDLTVIWGFWDRIRSADDPVLGHVLSRVWPILGAVLSIGALIFGGFLATFPGERADEHRRKVLTDIPYWMPLHELLFAGAADEVTGQPRSLFSNRLVLTDQTFVDSEKLEKVEISRSFRGRDLRGAVLNRADLRKADFTGAILDNAELIGAKLEKAQFGCASRGRDLTATQSDDGCTSLQGASLYFAQLQGASLDGTQLQGASLKFAQLQGASLESAQLQGASLYFAQLQGASLDFADLQGASLDSADLQGASLVKAKVWRVAGTKRSLDLTSLRELNCTDISWGGPNISRTYQGWRDRILSTIPEGDRKRKAGQRLSALDPDNNPMTNLFWNETQCPEQGPDPRLLADYLVTLACSAEAAPHVARGLIRRNGRMEATGVEIATIADRLRKGKADAKTCPGVEGFTQKDWAQLDELVARVQKATAETSAPSDVAHPDGPRAP